MTQTTTTVYLAHLNPDDDIPTLGDKVFFTQAEAEQDLLELALNTASGISDSDLDTGEHNDLFHPDDSPLEKLQALYDSGYISTQAEVLSLSLHGDPVRQLLGEVDWEDLFTQKEVLVALTAELREQQRPEVEALTGLVYLLDALQDIGDACGLPAYEDGHEHIILKAGQYLNVTMRQHHSTDGVPQCGYAGSGPADTALSILAALLPPPNPPVSEQLASEFGYPTSSDDWETFEADLSEARQGAIESRRLELEEDPMRPVQLHDRSRVPMRAWMLHQAFKEEFLAGLDETQEHRIPKAQIREWIEKQSG
ncbi:hypothetical protein Deipr_2395 (plasmid) [Deinococcus proteolyticus MRP]|uniref:Uncharacterized protein n=1 Tax=Deinococcus proteolyticus (strain ATCC 35074 / DSM 20540 / JCM 6276 / NBRC 101906 / NCIMB 13154 / VKM Ac-1939 / CCM 2703 / MRP) TaxID=693977 RepID=F0RQG0_DEIPM|nr:hypothetical protein [Deinococcus proteolyticus]ADY27519.1 hypothetical protein Deipr_2395 [Deinococcus proteolyticus MRP]